MVEYRTQEVRGPVFNTFQLFKLSRGLVNTQKAVSLSQHDKKIIDCDVKTQLNLASLSNELNSFC